MDLMYVFLLLVIFALGMWAWKLQCDKVEADREARLASKERDEYVEIGKGLAEYNQKVQKKKDEVKNKILEILEGESKISNRDITNKLNISRASVIRYLDELEAEGKVKQIGKTGKMVYYSK